MSSEFTVTAACGTTRTFDNRQDAEDGMDTHAALCEECGDGDVEITTGDGGSTPEVVDEPAPVEKAEPPSTETTDDGLQALGDSLTDDPLDVLPGYMITEVDGDPTLNKRGVSVLAFHYDVEVVDYEVVAYPHDTDYTGSVVQFTVEREGKQYVGHGEAHADEVDKSKLLRMAETRAYKRAVIFATGTGIVGYQEVMSELEQ